MRSRCFALLDDFGCDALSIRKCMGTGCSFYKSIDQAEMDKVRSYRKIAKMKPMMQRYVSEKYFDNQKPWEEIGDSHES